ncbi:hypothetical protein [Streptomyces sp. NPDC086023]|uniref:hypothetical protein n=1 Tax=Streptomyces sp. NPDC086023 TaxID=3365746 RepID=UPI0037D1505A
MSSRIDLVVGGVRAAELVNAYRERLERLDLLSPHAALNVACYAYASGCVHVLAAPGQVWIRDEDGGRPDDPEAAELHVLEIGNTESGHFALCREPCGIEVRVPLEQLGRGYALARWPQEDGSGRTR